MRTIEGLRKYIAGTEDLHSVVRTMKALAAVNIRQFQKASEAVKEYNQTVELGLGMVLRLRPDFLNFLERDKQDGRHGVVLFGSDQGMCGQLNSQVAEKASKFMAENNLVPDSVAALIVGERITGLAEDLGIQAGEFFSVPGSVGAITSLAKALLPIIDSWREKGVGGVDLFFSRPSSGSASEPVRTGLLPLDLERLKTMRESLSTRRGLPKYTMEFGPLFSALIRQHLFFSLFQASADSLASENAMRLASMQGAEKNIEERLAELENEFHQTRQMAITEELLDIVSGFEALKGDGESMDN